MERARQQSRQHQRGTRGRPTGSFARSALISGVALGALLLTGCDSVSGIPGDPADPGPVEAAPASTTTTTATTPAVPVLPPPPADAPPVGAVAGQPEAADAVRRWAADLTTGTAEDLRARCWNLAPGDLTTMYADPDAVLAALAEPGAVEGDAIVWDDGLTTVLVDPTFVVTGYACPRVYAAGETIAPSDADARHTVRRYLARAVGAPLDPADTEADHPLVCRADTDWDPQGTGVAAPAPLTEGEGALTGITAFESQQISSARLSTDYVSVQVPVTDSTGTTKTRTFTLTAGAADAEGSTGATADPDGPASQDRWCVGEISR